jgi:outer membrane lipoprotein carrier protein
MNRLVLLFALFFAPCLVAEPPNLTPPGSAREQLNRFTTGLETLQARFEQKVISGDGAVEDSSGGRVWLSRPQRFRWEYGGDFPEVVVADGERVWIHDITLEQVTVEDQSSAAADSPLTLLTDPDQLDAQFEVREAGEAGDLQLLELRSRSMESDFERLLLGLRDGRLELMIMEDAFGLRTELRFMDVQRNPVLDDVLFTFIPPGGVDVIGDVK